MIKIPYVKKFGKAVGLGVWAVSERRSVRSVGQAGSGCVGDRGRRQWDDSGLFGGTRTAGPHGAASPRGKPLFPL